MNSLRSAIRSRRVRPASATPTALRPDLGWIHDGIRHRVTVWPDVRFERETEPEEWTVAEIGEDVLASAALGVTANQWRRYLEYVPTETREFLLRFEFGRMAAWHVITACPGLMGELKQLPALTPFLTMHLSLRGGENPRWSEISAVGEREGVFGVLQWLGLPASRQTLAILENIADPDIPRRLLEPLRTALWQPESIWMLSHERRLTDERLAVACHALAA